MGLDQHPLQRWLDALLAQRFRRARALAGWRAGARTAVDLARVASREPSLATPEPFLGVQDAIASASDAERPALRRLALALAREQGEVAGAKAHGRALERLASAQVSVELELRALTEVLAESATCPDRKRRAQLWRASDAALREVEGDQAEQVERRLESRARLELSSESAWCALAGIDAASLAGDAELLLRETRDAAMDLLEFRMRRANAGAGQGGQRHDFSYALELLDLREHLPPHLAPMLAEQLARGLGLEPFAQGVVRVDAEARTRRWPGLQVAEFGPEELAVISAPLGAPGDLDRLARGLGEALHRTSIERGGIERFLLDDALPLATARLFALPLTDPGWSRRVLRLPARAAHELARGFATRALFDARLAAAQLLAARELESQGPSAELADHFRSRMNVATGVDWGGQGAFELDLLDAAAALRAHLLAEQLGRAMVEHFNEDWWRNPHARELLSALWSPGGAVDLPKLVGEAPSTAVLLGSMLARAAT